MFASCCLSSARFTNEVMNFAIFLRKDDFSMKYCSKSYAHKVSKEGNELPGLLRIFDYDEIMPNISTFTDIKVDGPIIPRKLYIELPDESAYVLIEDYDFKTLMIEKDIFIQIISMLGVKKIKWQLEKHNSNNKKIEGGIGVNVNEIDVNVKAGYGNNTEIKNMAHGEMKFNNNTIKIKDIEDLENKLNDRQDFYYRKYRSQWREYINKVLEHNLQKDEFIHHYNNKINLFYDILLSLKFFNINFEQNEYMSTNTKIEYKIEFDN